MFGKRALDLVGVNVGHVEMDVLVARLLHRPVDGTRDDVPGREVFPRVHALHDPLARQGSQTPRPHLARPPI